MKLANYISMCGIALCLLSACDSDLEKTVYDEGMVKPSVLQAIESSYTLEAANAEKVVATFEWSKPDVGYKGAVTNSLEIALAGDGFKKSSVLSSSNDKYTSAITVATLNKAVLKLLNDVFPSESVEVEFRISSSISNATSPFMSNVVKTKIMPYSMEKEYPFISVRGGYCGWDFLTSQKIYSKEENHDYAGMVFFGEGNAGGEWKLCSAEDWGKPNWGYSSGANEAPEVILSLGAGNVGIYSKMSYYMEFNDETCVLKMTKAHNSWGINKKGASESDVEMELGKSTVNGVTTHMLSATVDLKAGDNWRIRPDNADTDAIAPTAVEHAISVDGDYFKVEEDGTYLITWIFNKVTPQLTIKKQ